MATLDVSFVPGCPEFADTIEVIRRTETLDYTGRSVISEAPPAAVLATIYPTGDNRLVRQSDFEHGNKTLTLVTTYRLQTAAPGYQPDVVLYRGNRFVVTSIEDYSQYGAGFVVAECSSMLSIDVPPQMIQ